MNLIDALLIEGQRLANEIDALNREIDKCIKDYRFENRIKSQKCYRKPWKIK